VVLEAPDGVALAGFYASLFGWPIAKQDDDGAAIAVPGTSSYLAFQSAPDSVGLGATLAEFQPQEDVRVLLDPAGHPFCLYFDHELD